MNAAPVAAANRRFSKIVRSSIGARPWRSISTNSGSSTTPAIRPPITTGSFQPLIPPLETPSVSPVRPATNVVVPRMSSPRLVSRRASSWSTPYPQAAPSSANGTLNQNTQCQEIETSAPPSTGPSTSPIAAIIVFVPIASPSCSRGKASVTSAAALANRNAAPMPWRIRHRISSVPFSAKPAPSEVSAKTTKPPT